MVKDGKARSFDFLSHFYLLHFLTSWFRNSSLCISKSSPRRNSSKTTHSKDELMKEVSF